MQKLVFFKCIFGKEKKGFGIVTKKCGMRDSREKGAGMRDQDPLPDPVTSLLPYDNSRESVQIKFLPRLNLIIDKKDFDKY